MSKEFNRTLTSTGQLVEIMPAPDCPIIQAGEKSGEWSEIWRYYVRFVSGDHYFVTREWIPSFWPFASLHHGRLRSIRIRADLLISRMGIRPLYNSLSLMVYSKSHRAGLIERLARGIDRDEYGEASIPPPQGFGLFIKADWNALLLGSEKTKDIIKFPLSNPVMMKMKHHAENIDALSAEVGPRLNAILPEIVDRDTLCGQAYWSERRIDGVAAMKFRWLPGRRRRAIEAGFGFLMDLHQSTRQPTWLSRDRFDELLCPHIITIEQKIKEIDPAFDLESFVEALWPVFRDKRISLVRTHGDFWPANLLISDDLKLTGVLDWDMSIKSGWPLLDLLNLITFQYKWLTIWHFGFIVTKRLMPSRFAKWERQMIEKYCAALAIEDNLWPGFVALYWLHRISQVVSLFDEAWVKRNVIKPLPRIIEAISVG